MSTVLPLDRDGKRCPYTLVDPSPHHYRIQGYRWVGHMDNADAFADTAEEAEDVRVSLEARGYRGLSILPPQCDGSGHYGEAR